MNLILYDNNMNLFPRHLENIVYVNVFKKIKSKPIRIIRKIHISSIMPFKKIWFDNWWKKYNEKDLEKIVVFGCGNGKNIVKFLNKIYPKTRIIYWYWAPIEISLKPQSFKKEKCEFWTFDIDDSIKYKLNFNTQFYCFENKNRIILSNTDDEYDVVFVGTEKNRLNELVETQKEIEKQGLKTLFKIIKSNKHYKSDSNYNYSNSVSYDQYLEIISKTKAILDIISSDQSGMTLRPFESILFRKKLITNDIKIIDTDIYNPNNIFVIGYDNINDISLFMNKKYDYSNEKLLLEKYSIQSWIKRFDIGDEKL